jgi:signal transduction histidine kinase
MERRTNWERIRGIDPRIADGVLAAGVLAITLVGSFLARQPPDRGDLDVAGVMLIVAACVPLAARRRAPIAVVAAVAVAAVAYAGLVGAADLFLPVVVASYTAAAYEPRERVVRFAGPIAVVAGLAMQVAGAQDPTWLELASSLTFVVGIPLALGRGSFNRRRRLRADRAQAAHEAVTKERARIARELHDVVAHAMSVMVVQAGAARTVLGSDPEQAQLALRRVEETGRSGLAEMRRLIGLLQADESADDTFAPQPGLGQLDQLLDTVRSAGLPVEAITEGTPVQLPPGVGLTAYRVAQEGLTNVLKHAGPAHARVVVRYVDDALDLEVADDGRGPSHDPDAALGHGLIGMRERVALFDGSLEAGERVGGGFELRVRIPLGTAEPS